MKHYFIFFLFILVISCNDNKNQEPTDINNNKLNIVVTTYPIKDLVENIVGDKAVVTSLLAAGVDPHLYKASEKDLNKLNNADIIVYNGLHLEGRLEDVLKKIGSKTVTINLSEGIDESELLKSASSHDDHDHGHEHGHSHEEYDPHIWLDINIWKNVASDFARTLIKIDEKNEVSYKENLNNYLSELDSLYIFIQTEINKIPIEKRILITSHNAYSYFGRGFGLETIGIQGISTSHQAGAYDISKLSQFIIDNKLPSIFTEKSVSQKSAIALQEAVNSRDYKNIIGTELKIIELENAGAFSGSYIDMMKNNTIKIVKALANEWNVD